MKKYIVLIKHNIDFILLDLLAFILGYYSTVEIRYLLNEPVWHGELFVQFGTVVAIVYILIAIITQNYRGIMQRGFFREARAVIVQQLMTWAVFALILYLIKNAQNFSRSVYCSAAVLCTVFIYLERVLWKGFVRNNRRGKNRLPGLLVVCDSNIATIDVDRMLAGSFFNEYQIAGVVMDETGECDYRDRFPYAIGLDKLEEFIVNKDIQDAYIDLSDANKERETISKLFQNNIIVHKSLGDSKLDYQEQILGELGGNSVITISAADISYSKRMEQLGHFIWKQHTKPKTKCQEQKDAQNVEMKNGIPVCSILGVKIAAINMEWLIEYLKENITKIKGNYICVSNVHTTVTASENPEYMEIQNGGLMAIPDGGPLSTVGKKRGYSEMKRTTGPSLMEEILKISAENGWKHYFYGSTEETLQKMKEKIETKYPGVEVVGLYSPPFRKLSVEEDKVIIGEINASAPDFIWVGLGAPKQEIWMAEHQWKVNGLMIGVGAGFDYLAGTIQRAPEWMQDNDMEWFYRLMQEPKRLFSRYWKTNWKFVWNAYIRKK